MCVLKAEGKPKVQLHALLPSHNDQNKQAPYKVPQFKDFQTLKERLHHEKEAAKLKTRTLPSG